MKVNILRKIPWFGGNYFHPTSFDENSFKLEGCLRAGKSIPTHYHKYFDEYWIVKKGTPVFISGNEKFIPHPGETFSAPKLVPHSIVNNTSEDIILITLNLHNAIMDASEESWKKIQENRLALIEKWKDFF